MNSSLAKPRIDAWDAALSDEQRWQVYDRFRRYPWYEVVEWIGAELGVTPPGRSSLYRWADRMRKLESARRVERAIQAQAEIDALAGTAAANDKLIAGYKSMAAEMALDGDAKTAVRLTQMAMSLAAQQTAQMELALKQQRIEQQAEAQRLAREKFEAAEARLAAVKDALANARREGGGLSAEALREIEQAAGLL